MTESTLHTPTKHTHVSNEPIHEHKGNSAQSSVAAVSAPRSSNNLEKTQVTLDQKVIVAALTTKNNETALHIKDAKIILPLNSAQHQQVKQWQSDQKTINIDIRSEPPAIRLSAVPANKVKGSTHPTAVNQNTLNTASNQSDVNTVSKQNVSPVVKANAKEAQAINLTVLQNKPSMVEHATPKIPTSSLKPTPVLLQQASDIQKLHLHVPKIDAVLEVRLPKLSPEIANLIQKVPPNTFALLDVSTGQNKISSTQLPLQIDIDGLDIPITIKVPIAEKSASLLLNVLQQQLPSQFQIPSKIFSQWLQSSDLAQVLPAEKMLNLSTLLSKSDVVHVAKTQQGMTIETVNTAKNINSSGTSVMSNVGNNIGISKDVSINSNSVGSLYSDSDRSISIILSKTQLLAIEQANAFRNPSQVVDKQAATTAPIKPSSNEQNARTNNGSENKSRTLSQLTLSQLTWGQENLGLKNILGTMKELLGVTGKNQMSLQPTHTESSSQTNSMGQAGLTKNKIVLNHLSLFKELQYAGAETKNPIIPNELNKLLHKTNDTLGLTTNSPLQLDTVTNKPVTELGQQLAANAPESDINNLLKVFAANSLVTGLENQLRAPQQTSSLLSGLTTMVQIALAQKLNTQINMQMGTQDGLTHALKQQLKPFVPVTTVSNNGRNNTENTDTRNSLVNGIAQVLKNHSQARKINAEVNTQAMDTQYFILPNITNQNKDNIEILFKKEHEHANTKEQDETKQGWHVSLRFTIGEYGVLLTKAFIQNKIIQLNLYASSTPLLDLVNKHKETLETRLSELGFDLKGYQSFQGKIPESLIEQQHEIWQTQV